MNSEYVWERNSKGACKRMHGTCCMSKSLKVIHCLQGFYFLSRTKPGIKHQVFQLSEREVWKKRAETAIAAAYTQSKMQINVVKMGHEACCFCSLVTHLLRCKGLQKTAMQMSTRFTVKLQTKLFWFHKKCSLGSRPECVCTINERS